MADTISMRSEDVEIENGDEEDDCSTATEKRKGSTLRNLMQTMHTVDIFKKQKKEEKSKVLVNYCTNFSPMTSERC